MKRKVSWLQAVVEVLQALTVVVTFLIGVAELLHEGPKAGEEKKKWVMSQLDAVKKEVTDVLSLLYDGDKVIKVWEFITQPKIVSFVIDVLVLLFNQKGFFPKG